MFKKLNDFCEDWRVTLIAGAFLAASLILLLTGHKWPVDPAWISVTICGWPLVYSALTRLFLQRKITSALLVSIAMISAIAIGELFAAGEIAFIMAVGELLEDKTVARARRGLASLIALAPRTGRHITTRNDRETVEEISAEKIETGFRLRVLPGETIPADGIILSGNTTVDQSIMTGESLPVDKTIGDKVFCGTINRFGVIEIEATHVGEQSSLRKMIQLVREAEMNKAPTQRIVDQWASWLVPIALLIAVCTYLFTLNITRAVTVLVVFCPCALALATPTSIMAAIGQATKRGVLIKSGEALELMGKIDCIAFDKTGTLTTGKLEVCDVIPVEGTSDRELLEIAAQAEMHSEHPLGKAVVRAAQRRRMEITGVSGFSMIPGRGVAGTWCGKQVLCGNAHFLQSHKIQVPSSLTDRLIRLHQEGKAVILAAYGDHCLGVIALADEIRSTAKSVMNDLKNLHAKIVLLTGDHRETACYFAEQTGIEEVHAELLPEQKVAELRRLRAGAHHVCMIGDGVNDAPAFKTADVGVAMASIGSDIAIEAADIALMGDNIENIPYLKRLSNATIFSIRFNISLSMLINLIAVTLSVLGVLTPVWGALVHNAGSVLVVLNAALLYDRKI